MKTASSLQSNIECQPTFSKFSKVKKVFSQFYFFSKNLHCCVSRASDNKAEGNSQSTTRKILVQKKWQFSVKQQIWNWALVANVADKKMKTETKFRAKEYVLVRIPTSDSPRNEFVRDPNGQQQGV